MIEPIMHRPSRAVCFVTTCALSLCSLPLLAAGIVAPNETLVLRSSVLPSSPDGQMEDCSVFSADPVQPPCVTGLDNERAEAQTSSSRPFERSTATISIFYDFEVDAGAEEYDTVLNARIAGKGEFNGFLALLAGGQASGSVSLMLFDLGETGGALLVEPQLIHKESLSKHELNGKVTTGIGFGITVEGGAPYIGLGGSPKLGFNIDLETKIIRDSVNFGFGALLRRGHSYRILFEVKSESRRWALQGITMAEFMVGDDIINLLDPDNWQETLTSTLDVGLPNLKPASMRIKEGLDWLNNKRMIEPEFENSEGEFMTLSSTNALLNKVAPASFPKSFVEIITSRFNVARELQELISKPGFGLHELTVTVEPDIAAILADQTARINEVLRLLVLPQGQRSTDFIECDSPGNSGSNGNGNGNAGNCRFPATGTSVSTTGTTSGSPSPTATANATDAPVMTTALSTESGAGAVGVADLLAALALIAWLRLRSRLKQVPCRILTPRLLGQRGSSTQNPGVRRTERTSAAEGR